MPHNHIDLAITVAIAAGSVLLFGYWFRYTCLLILSAKTAYDYAGAVASANHLSCLDVQAALRDPSFVDFDPLRAAVERDYTLITYLLKNSVQAGVEESFMETRMLAMHYRLSAAWYRVSRPFYPEAARSALQQMTAVVAHFANVMGERVALASPA